MIRSDTNPTGRRRVAAALVLGLWLMALPLAAQVPADSLFRDFQLADYQFELDGAEPEGAEVYLSQRAAAYLILAPELSSPVLVNPRTRSVESVHLMKVMKKADGSIDLLADATFDYLGTFRVVGKEVTFEIKGKSASLKPKPPLLGLQPPATLRSHKPEYDRLARGYQPAASHLESLRAERRDVRVLVYFGTWCPTCSRLVPKMLRVTEELDGSALRFEYYGLPGQLSDDPVSARDKIHGVPTGIVYIDGKEVARLGVQELNQPEAALHRILNAG